MKINSHSTPKVSIIIPVYNVAEYVEASLTSAFNQTYKNIEYILVDDCSTDNSIEIVQKLLENRHLYKQRSNHNKARTK